jgi:hypothetical protein
MQQTFQYTLTKGSERATKESTEQFKTITESKETFLINCIKALFPVFTIEEEENKQIHPKKR